MFLVYIRIKSYHTSNWVLSSILYLYTITIFLGIIKEVCSTYSIVILHPKHNDANQLL